ncbi:carboxylesterase 2 [Sideroxyarcus emersonii]|uniref:Carboxylesterase 2 n=1 Tax=Sideroxyarcus emersonii TaxID=2764705 RepID=A0AAN1XBL4_9PROT|nr:alpha/beta hydrolase [Sideroxyarcus emersonii]BCK88309.1 carboxylesterase 2 [Sideroxyarcus emersonii]
MTSVLPCITLETGNNPKSSIIWLHGLGADGEDFAPIAQELGLPVAVRYIFPHAPMRPVTINGGYVMRAWYDILGGAAAAEIAANIGRQEDAAGIRTAQALIENLIALEKQRGIAASHIYLAGFSQGGAVALHTGLRHKERLGGILALSTYLPLPQTLPIEADASARQTPIFMAHGQDDPVIPHAFGRASAEELLRQGYTLEWHDYPMPHSVCPEEIRDIERWLRQRLSA